MPHISIEGPQVSVEKKRVLVKRLTEVASEVYGVPKEKFMIHVSEFSKENVSTGGVLLVDK